MKLSHYKQNDNDRKKKRYWFLFLEIASPILSIVISIISASFNFWSADIRVAILSCGIAVPLIILQTTIDEYFEEQRNRIKTGFSDVNNKIESLSNKLNPLSPMFEKIIAAKSDRLQTFAIRRITEVSKVINHALNEGDSGNLNPTEYYDELNSLATMIEDDYRNNYNNYKGEIWAMTSFAPNEWIAEDNTYEGLWSDRLLKLSEYIKVRRICLITNNLKKSMQDYKASTDLTEEMNGFAELYKCYKQYNNVCHYVVSDSSDTELREIKGFFGIKLHNGDLFLIYGETVDEKGAMIAKSLFDVSEITRIYNKFNRFTKDKVLVDNFLDTPEYAHFYQYLNPNNKYGTI